MLIGGNVGDRKEWLSKARNAIRESCGRIIRVSSIYETEAWGNQQQEAFLNQALLVQTEFTAQKLLKAILKIEGSLGRKRETRYGPRTIDIDIIFFNHLILETENLVIPHPEMHNRKFALECLNEIAPDHLHPKLDKTVSELLTLTNDPLKVNKIY